MHKDLSAMAHMALKKHWEHHYDPMVLSVLDTAEGHVDAEEYGDALEIYNSVIREFPFWSHVYGLRAQVHSYSWTTSCGTTPSLPESSAALKALIRHRQCCQRSFFGLLCDSMGQCAHTLIATNHLTSLSVLDPRA